MRARRPGMSVIVATAYMEEAERFDWLVAMNAGKRPGDGLAGRAQGADRRRRRSRTPSSRCCRESSAAGTARWQIPPRAASTREPVIAARDLTCRFGDFTAVDHVSFTIERGEIFGFLGSNGCGKTTTMKMLTGLLPATEGEALLFGQPVDADDIELAPARRLHVAVVLALYRAHRAAEPRSACAPVPSAGATRPRAASPSSSQQFGLARLSRSARRRAAARHPPAAVAGGRRRARARDC